MGDPLKELKAKQEVKSTVRNFYDQVGWQIDETGLYQNASYEDLRPVSHEYIHRCHMRVNRYLSPQGKYLLDAGSGPVQYPEYVTYSQGYQARVCMDISIVALIEARKKLGDAHFYVVGDISKLPFSTGVFDGIVSLHTIHHLPIDEKVPAYVGLNRCLAPGRSMVTVDGWGYSPLMSAARCPMALIARILYKKDSRQGTNSPSQASEETNQAQSNLDAIDKARAGTFVTKTDARWLKHTLRGKLPFKIKVWRSVSTRFLRTMIQPQWGGRGWLRILYVLEELFPRFMGENGQYPLLVITKPAEQLKNSLKIRSTP